ncbi:hypothetical protein IKE83_01310, partial [Candidatus Saccharibacteria bacterium]|nr:hypothetical protein [Candidatus Saccharibacteria bacterium]
SLAGGAKYKKMTPWGHIFILYCFGPVTRTGVSQFGERGDERKPQIYLGFSETTMRVKAYARAYA